MARHHPFPLNPPPTPPDPGPTDRRERLADRAREAGLGLWGGAVRDFARFKTSTGFGRARHGESPPFAPPPPSLPQFSGDEPNEYVLGRGRIALIRTWGRRLHVVGTNVKKGKTQNCGGVTGPVRCMRYYLVGVGVWPPALNP